jgi:energy-coupling factor transporter ATP-binding protein EcfA2
MDVSSRATELAEAVGLVAQEPETQVSARRSRRDRTAARAAGDGAGARSRAVEEVALALAIDGLLERTTDTLSGGELQRVALAAASRPGPGWSC